MIEIFEIQIIPIKPKNGLMAFASFVINNQFYVGNIAIYQSPSTVDGYRLVYPDKILPNGKRINCIHPINRHVADVIHNAIIGEYKKLTEEVINHHERTHTLQ